MTADYLRVTVLRTRALPLAIGCVLAWVVLYELAVLTHAVPLHGIFFGRSAHLITDAAAGVLCAIAALRQRGGARLAWLLIALTIRFFFLFFFFLLFAWLSHMPPAPRRPLVRAQREVGDRHRG